jgi:lysophospholipase L1-like esterase
MTAEERAARRRARKRELRRRRLLALGIAVCIAGLAAGVAAWASVGNTRSAPRHPQAAQAKPCRQTRARRKVIVPAWLTTRRATVLVDSVLLGGIPALRSNFSRWHIDVIGRPAIMLPAMEQELRASGRRVAPLVILGVGHNSLWEKDRRNYGTWSARFDREATELLNALRRLGASELIWVTLRQARRAVIPSSALWQYDKYSWYFPYVNERLRLLDRKRTDLALADWAAVSNRSGITYDAFHLRPEGAALMARTIRAAVEAEGRAETRSVGPAVSPACKQRHVAQP